MSSHFTVVFDACVLYPAPLRDLLMRLALTDRFRAQVLLKQGLTQTVALLRDWRLAF